MKPVRQIGNAVLPRLPPQPKMPVFPTFNLATETLPAHNAMLQPFMQGTGPRPMANMPNIPIVQVPEVNMGAENFQVALPTNHSVHENFGGDPRFEAQQMLHRPTNPRSFGMAPTFQLRAEPKSIPLTEKRYIPKANMPNIPSFDNIGPSNPLTLSARPVTRDVRGKDMGGILSSTSPFGQVGMSAGRSFGAESFLMRSL